MKISGLKLVLTKSVLNLTFQKCQKDVSKIEIIFLGLSNMDTFENTTLPN